MELISEFGLCVFRVKASPLLLRCYLCNVLMFNFSLTAPLAFAGDTISVTIHKHFLCP
ncbi:hypothetical protein SOHN41_03142 [Shewanella sp. HN-41]|nr:hypothetical protein SOHN41_03142 [Shewanella sp. HN-41]